jgi:hypothetical protein
MNEDREVLMTSGAYPWSFVTQIFHNGQPSHGGDRKTFKVMTSTTNDLPTALEASTLTITPPCGYYLNDKIRISWGELRCSGRVGSSCSTSDTRRVNLVTNPVISHEWGKDREVFMTSGTSNSSFKLSLYNVRPSLDLILSVLIMTQCIFLNDI